VHAQRFSTSSTNTISPITSITINLTSETTTDSPTKEKTTINDEVINTLNQIDEQTIDLLDNVINASSASLDSDENVSFDNTDLDEENNKQNNEKNNNNNNLENNSEIQIITGLESIPTEIIVSEISEETNYESPHEEKTTAQIIDIKKDEKNKLTTITVEETFNLFWFIPVNITSEYTFNENGTVVNKPWYSWLEILSYPNNK
jgi:hypothetical protein